MWKNLSRLAVESWILAILIVVGAGLRFYHLPQTLQFLGDQGRDAMIVARIFNRHDPVFIGPVSSVGNIYLGPLYYYFMLPWLWLSYPSPVGPAYAVAILSVITIWLIYHWGRELVGRRAALVAAGIFTFNYIAVTYSRFSWNPNPAPLLATALVFSTYKALQGRYWYWIIVSVLVSLLIQLHYVTLLAAAAAGGAWLWQAWQLYQKRQLFTAKAKWWWLSLSAAILIFLASLTPLMLFDSKHEWLNAKAFGNLIWQEDNFNRPQVSGWAKVIKTIRETHGRSLHVLFETNLGKNRGLNTALWLVVIFQLWLLLTTKSGDKSKLGLNLIAWFLFVGILGISAYEHTVFDHYILYLFPIAAWTLGIVVTSLWDKLRISRPAILILGGYFLVFSANRWPLTPADWSISDVADAAQTIYQRVQPGEKYNVVLLSGTGDIDAQNYRYFLETTDRPPVATANRGEVETLFIINEAKLLKKVTDSPVYEIVVFPEKSPREVYTIPDGPEITVLKKMP